MAPVASKIDTGLAAAASKTSEAEAALQAGTCSGSGQPAHHGPADIEALSSENQQLVDKIGELQEQLIDAHECVRARIAQASRNLDGLLPWSLRSARRWRRRCRSSCRSCTATTSLPSTSTPTRPRSGAAVRDAAHSC